MSYSEITDEAALQAPEFALTWYLAYTRPRMEETALVNLERQGFHAYLPLFKTIRPTADGLRQTHVAMFPRYLFLRPATEWQSLSVVGSTRGLQGLVKFGSEPAIVPPEIIQNIKEFELARERAGVEAISPIQPGARVRIRKSGLNGLEGLVVSIAKNRVTFLLELLGREKAVTVDHGELEMA